MNTPRYRPNRTDLYLGPRMFADELHRLRKIADEALDSIDPMFVGCFGYDTPACLVGASDTPDREDATLHGEVGRGHVVTSTRSVLPAWVTELIERVTYR